MHYPILLFSPVPMNIGINQNLFMNSKALHALTLVYGPPIYRSSYPTLNVIAAHFFLFWFPNMVVFITLPTLSCRLQSACQHIFLPVNS